MNYLSLLRRPIAFDRVFIDVTGCVNAALLLSQIVYWHPRAGQGDWFHKTAEEWNDEIGLSVRELETARRTLVTLGVIQYRRAGMPAKPFYRLDEERLNALLGAIYHARNADACSAENAEQDSPKAQNMSREKRVAKSSETTAETTCNNFANAQLATGQPSAKKTNATFTLPDWIPAEAWTGYVEMRKTIRKPLTDRAKTLAISELAKLNAEGHDPAAVLNQSTLHSWQGLFPLKGSAPGVADLKAKSAPKVNQLPTSYGKSGRL